jgi:hypothetical protein
VDRLGCRARRPGAAHLRGGPGAFGAGHRGRAFPEPRHFPAAAHQPAAHRQPGHRPGARRRGRRAVRFLPARRRPALRPGGRGPAGPRPVPAGLRAVPAGRRGSHGDDGRDDKMGSRPPPSSGRRTGIWP